MKMLIFCTDILALIVMAFCALVLSCGMEQKIDRVATYMLCLSMAWLACAN